MPAVAAHEECLKMLFSNLIVNAIKYNKQNGIIKIAAEEEAENLIISVSDTGIGIPKDKQELIFEEFYRVKDESTRNISGTGLGLPICKKIAEELGGQIAIKTNINEGSSFYVYLPKFKD